MSVLCRHYHVSLIAPGLSAGPCRVSNLVGLSNPHSGKNLCLTWSRGEAEPFLFAHFEMPARPDLSVIEASGSGAP